jgi:electron transfer flavoprotein alpha subunit
MANYRNVMIYGEGADGSLTSMTRELLGGGRKLADQLGEELYMLLMGEQVSNLAEEAGSFGVDKIYVVEDPRLRDYLTDHYTSAMTQVVETVLPKVLLFGQNDVGEDLAPRLAFRLGVPVSMDCVNLDIDPHTKQLLRTKPVYGGIAMGVYVAEGFPQVATVRAKSLPAAERNTVAEAPIIPINVNLDRKTQLMKFAERVVEYTEGVKLEDAEVVISGGRGIGGVDGFRDLETAAKVLKAAVGGSRAAVDNGWLPNSYQVGLTGTIVAPKLYIAVAISGASQHMTGCSRSKRIVAINKDPRAPIFKQAHFGVVGDWKVVLPAFIEKLKSLEL